MRHIALLILLGLALTCGCHSLVRDVAVAEYRPEGEAATTTAAADGSYQLYAPNAQTWWVQADVVQGGVVGFRRNPDGSVVAVAGDQVWPVDPAKGRHVWLCTPRPATAWDRLVVGTRNGAERAAVSVALALSAPFWLPRCAMTDAWP